MKGAKNFQGGRKFAGGRMKLTIAFTGANDYPYGGAGNPWYDWLVWYVNKPSEIVDVTPEDVNAVAA